jgi:hypothetical protein
MADIGSVQAGPINILTPGSRVTVGESIAAVIVEVLIGSDLQVQYKIAWWNGRARCCEWLESCELQDIGQATNASVGFCGGAG